MNYNIKLIAKQFWSDTFRPGATYLLLMVNFVLLIYAGYSGFENYRKQDKIREYYQAEARHSWEANPDKHPHRMAHFGTFAFRKKHPLSIFDFGVGNFTGNAVFLEAHKQNSVNFSEASFSTGMLRFGELSMAMILQVIVPLIVFFLGFSCVSSEYEKGILKISIIQGASWKEILFGKSLGLFGMAMVFYLPFMIVTLVILMTGDNTTNGDVLIRFACLFFAYPLYYFLISTLTVLISAMSKNSKDALIRLLAIWLIFVIFSPKAMMALGYYYYPSPSKIEFETLIEQELIRKGDSHNPDDPYFQALRDSVLQVHRVNKVEELPFNYSGFVMREGERNSSEIYLDHKNRLMQTYRKQYSLVRYLSIVNPYLAIKNFSMALTGTDFESYVDFQNQAENYRYQLAQKMNELQMEHISNRQQISTGGTNIISRKHWTSFPDFNHYSLKIGDVWRSVWESMVSLLLWASLLGILTIYYSRKAKAV